MTQDVRILEYYNVNVGKDPSEKDSDFDNFKKDKYNNLKGDEFDLGKNDAFRNYRILIGNFFQRGEFSVREFKCVTLSLRHSHYHLIYFFFLHSKYAKKALQKKGFEVVLVDSEEAFTQYVTHFVFATDYCSSASSFLCHKTQFQIQANFGLDLATKNLEAHKQFFFSSHHT